ncbi:MAG TPA: hypothetical protein VE991_10385, partial [Acidimicrobiales bacterium]|nr:hypothetical protein [Acidimicrobiales bacterium]
MPPEAGPAPVHRLGARNGWVVAAAAALYLAAGFALWWHAWRAPGSTIATASADPDQNVWWLAFLPHALGHAMSPFFTRAMYFPSGVNVVSNTSFPAVALLLSPVTALFGPLVSFNLAVSVVPAANAFTAFVVFRRYVQWDAARFVGALLYGFGPFVG